MKIPNRRLMYKLPWSAYDNQGGWVEVTDRCNLFCPGCYRQRLEGDKPLDQVKQEIKRCHQLTRCDTMVIAGGEPLIYPEIVEVVRFTASNGIKPLILTNGTSLDEGLLRQLKAAGLKRIHFHVDARQEREGWLGKNERELNELRQTYADISWNVGGIQCGFHITVARETLDSIPEIMRWFRSNTDKVQHISFIAFRGFPMQNDIAFYSDGVKIPDQNIFNSYKDTSEIDISTEDILSRVQLEFPCYQPSSYISGEAIPKTNKQLFIISIGARDYHLGTMGSISLEMTQVLSRLFRGKYFSFLKDPAVGKKVFFLALFDRQIRKAFSKFMVTMITHPRILLRKIWLQSIIIQQPIEFTGTEKNVCEHCVNPMIYEDILINPCELDQYRVFGNPVKAVRYFRQ